MMEETDYEIENNGKHYCIYKGNVLIAKTLFLEESPLHAIHVLNGSVKNHFYEELDGKVYRRIDETIQQ